MQRKQPKCLLDSFAILFYICKILGINPQDWKEFRRYKRLKESPIGEVLLIIGIIISFINYNLMLLVFHSKTYVMVKNALAIGIGCVLTYYSLGLLMCDRIYALLKQQGFLNIFKELEEIDEDLRGLNIILNNNYIKYRLVMGILLTTFVELLSFTLTFTMFVDKVNWTAYLWIYSCIPTYFNTLDKMWYIGIVIAIRKRFEAINNAIDNEALNMEQECMKERIFKTARKFKKTKKTKKYTILKNQIRPAPKTLKNVFGDTVTNSAIFSKSLKDISFSPPRFSSTSFDSAISTVSTYDTKEAKLIKYCQLHDTVCNVAKQLNEVYGFPILMLMGYGFFIIIAQLYFFYCANLNQAIPTMFRPARNWWITVTYIFYIAAKCICILYENWLTTLESKKTGICIHRCAVAADKNDTYEMINRLSLKLLNHTLNFNACGYFPLNMTTLFSFCGGITTYLIILIQFNLEGRQAKFKSVSGKSVALMQNDKHDSFVVEDVVNGTRTRENITSILSVFYQVWNTYFKDV